MSSERDICLRKADEAKQRARKQRNRPSRAHMKRWRSIGCYSLDWSLSSPSIAKTPTKKLTALPPGSVPADTQREQTKESPGHIRGFQGVDHPEEVQGSRCPGPSDTIARHKSGKARNA